MCFSAQASFIAGAGLIACSGLTISMAWQRGGRYLALASLPLFFGLQQVSEGFLWVSLNTHSGSPSVGAALTFLFFAYFFWPFWVPLSAALIETAPNRRLIFKGICGLGACLGLALYLPVLISPETLDIRQIRHSIQYGNLHVMPSEVAKTIARLIYALMICVPLVFSSDEALRGFGYLIILSVAFGFVFVSYAFTSIWCFIAAILSAYILLVLRRHTPETTPSAGALH